jgi:hypothetical protein
MPRTFFPRSFGNNTGGGVVVVTPPVLAVADLGDGTGGVATLTGGDASALNTLYRAAFTSGGGTLAFVASGTRTGPGAVPISGVPPGSYLWQVVAALGGAVAPSNLVLRALTAATAPGGGGVYWSILLALRDRLAALGLGVPVRLRKKLIRLPKDPTPLLVVAPGKGGEAVARQTFGYRAYWDYPAAVAYVTAGNQQLEAGLQAHMATREDVRNELLQARLPGVERVFSAKIDPDEVARFQESLGTNYDVDGFGLVCRTLETRRG